MAAKSDKRVKVEGTEEGEITDLEEYKSGLEDYESSSELDYNHNDGDDINDEDSNNADLSDDEFFHKATILPVAPIDYKFDPDKKPETGEEYLRMVRYEAKQLPFSQSAKPSSSSIDDNDAKKKGPVALLVDEIQGILDCTPVNRLPSIGFINSFMDAFTAGCLVIEQDDEFHQEIDPSPWPNVDDEEAWRHTLYGTTEHSIKVSRPPKQSKIHTLNPQDIKTVNLSPLIMGRLLHYHSSKWIPANRDDTLLTVRQYEFIIAILQSLDPRTTPYQIVRLRGLAKLLLRQRAEATEIFNDDLQRINGIIIAIAKRFGQSDLMSPLQQKQHQ